MAKNLYAGVGRAQIQTRLQPVHDPLYAKALVLDDLTTRLAIIALDGVAIGGICDISDSFLDQLRRRIASELAIPAEHILVSASHTHTKEPMLLPEDELLEHSFAAVQDAASQLQPVRAGWGQARESRLAINRTLRLKDGSQWTVRQAYPCPPDDLVDSLGPADDTIGILRLDKADGSPFVILYTFSCHPLLGVPGGLVTANYPGFASQAIEEATGAAAIFLQGALGDMTEVLYKDTSRPMDAQPLGEMLALAVLRSLPGILPGAESSLAVSWEKVRLPRQFAMPEQIQQLLAEERQLLDSLRFTSLNFKAFLPLYLKQLMDQDHPADYIYRYLHEEGQGSHALRAMDAKNKADLAKYLQNIRAMEKLSKIQDDLATLRKHFQDNQAAGESAVDCEIMALTIGGLALLSSPAEMLLQISLNLKKASPFADTWLISPANGYLHYGVPAADYNKGGYEATECMLAAGWQEIYEETARQLLAQLVPTQEEEGGS